MSSFKRFIVEATVDSFMSKIAACQTLEGLDELEKYYDKRVKEVELKATDDIAVRDAIAGRRGEFESANSEDEPKDDEF